MTEETRQAGTPAKKEKLSTSFFSHTPAIAAAAAGTIFSAVFGSFLGKTGTIIGLAAGSMISGSVTWWAERGIRKSAAIVKGRRDAARLKGRPLTPAETAMIDRVVLSQRRWKGIHWRPVLLFTITALILSAVAVSGVEALTGRTLHGVITGTNDRGYSIGHSYTPEPAVTRYVTPPPLVVTVTPIMSPDLAPVSPSPDAIPSSASPSTSSGSPVPATPSAVPDASVTADGTPLPQEQVTATTPPAGQQAATP